MPIDNPVHHLTRTALSPHLQIYRLPLTAWLSIAHRISGAILALVFVGLNGLITAAAIRPDIFEAATHWLEAPSGHSILFLTILLFNYHLVHGVRHLVWDMGHGFKKSSLTGLCLLEIGATLLLTCFAILAPELLAAGGSR